MDTNIFCNYCPGYCCYKLEGSTLFITAEDINRLARYFGIRDGEIRKNYMEGKNTFRTGKDGSCIFLQNGKLYQRCTIHAVRPRQCREFPYGEPCPYLHHHELIERIAPRIIASLQEKPPSAAKEKI